jgi:beta-lactamase class A
MRWWDGKWCAFLRILACILAAVILLSACDVPDESSSSGSTPTPGSGALPSVTPRPPRASPTARPTTEPIPLSTPQGTTGILSATPGPAELDTACLDAVEGRGTPVPGDVRFKSTTEPIELPKAYAPIPSMEDRKLQSELVDLLEDEADSYAFVVKDLRTGRTATHNAEAVFNSASVFKLWVMFEAFLQQDQDLLKWDTEYVVTPYYDAFALSPRSTELCQKITIAEAMDAMLSVSDNAAAVMLQDIVGAGNINNALASLGILNSGLHTDALPLTATDVAILLEAIARGQAVSPAASSDMLNLMSHEVMDNGLEAGLPKGVPVAHKTGNWSDATHDAGIVFAANGPYVFVALSATDHETEKIKAMSEAVYRYFGNQ